MSYNRQFHSRELFVTRPLALGAAVGGEIGAAGGQAQPRFEEMLNLTSNRKLHVKDIASGFKGESRQALAGDPTPDVSMTRPQIAMASEQQI